ncbi:MAG: hypothetical protein LBQ50_04170 [Planctomycetaceae bacterium]|jgi:hypothetical protein|nr:hypothetical protein [Planctomycetaceae bacterium]
MFNYFRQWEPNPVLLFELRQAVRNRLVIGLMLLYLLITVTVCFVLLCGENELVNYFYNYLHIFSHFPNNATQLAFLVFFSYYAFTTLTLVIFAALRTASDRLQESPVLFTMLSAQRIVFGKMLFGIVIGLLFLSITLPFLCVAYLMKGLDLRAVFYGAISYFCLIQIQYFVTVAFFAGAKNYTRIGVITLPLLLLQYLLVLFGIYGLPVVAVSSLHAPRVFVDILSFFFLAMLSAFLLATVQFVPKTSNRMFPIRVMFFVIQLLLSAAVLIGLVLKKDLNNEIFLTIFIDFLYFCFTIPFLFLFCICERDTVSERIKQTIPFSFCRRLLAFPFYTGAANAMVWCVLTLLLEGVVIYVPFLFFRSSIFNDYEALRSGFNFGLLFFNYCATTLLFYNLLLYRWISRTRNWMFPFILVAVFILFVLFANWIARFFSVSINMYKILEKLPFLPIFIPDMSEAFYSLQLSIGISWFLVLAVIGLPWLRRHFKEFRR